MEKLACGQFQAICTNNEILMVMCILIIIICKIDHNIMSMPLSTVAITNLVARKTDHDLGFESEDLILAINIQLLNMNQASQLLIL